jgi:4'-phosphopantetheinyl transferase
MKALPLLDDEIHVWQVSLAGDAEMPELQDCLSDDEVARAKRFAFVSDQKRFVRARAALRSILARYVPTDPRLIRFSYEKLGKPLLANHLVNRILHFNVSHSSNLALIAVASGFPVGIDIEQKRNDINIDELAAESFAPGERSAMALVCENRRVDAFYKTWTSKEAYLKGIGCGISAVREFEVCVDPEKPPRIVRPLSGEYGGAWFLHAINRERHYAATLATRRRQVRIICNDFTAMR